MTTQGTPELSTGKVISGRRVLVAVGGGIAAYKVCQVVSSLFQAGYQVRVILTETAQKFITPLTFSTLARHSAYTDADFWHPTQARPLHIELGEWAEVILIAPLTANTLGKLAQGLADDLLTSTVLASTCPILVAPAMNTVMWNQAMVQKNWRMLTTDVRYFYLEPRFGRLACDAVGPGRMAEPEELITTINLLLLTGGKRDLIGKKLLITGGGTQEYLDPVRFIGNPASGKMGLALAQAAHIRGANVLLIHGPQTLSIPQEIPSMAVTSAAELQNQLQGVWPNFDWLIMAAAVGDVRPEFQAKAKLSKLEIPNPLPLEFIPDLVQNLAAQKQPHQTVIGFAAQTGDIATPAWNKLQQKGLDFIVANPIDQRNSGFQSDHNQALIFHKTGQKTAVPLTSKLALAHILYNWILTLTDKVRIQL